MPKLSPSLQAMHRSEQLIIKLLQLAQEFPEEAKNISKELAIRIDEDSGELPKLIVQTKLDTLVELVFGGHRRPSQTSSKRQHLKEQIRHDLKLLNQMGILEDNRAKTQGSAIWHFTLRLWSTSPQSNTKAFQAAWKRYLNQSDCNVVAELRNG
jgi:hypothetical protein